MEPLLGWGLPWWDQAPTASALKLALCLLLLGSPRCAPAQLLCGEEEYPVGTECCPKCSPGYHVKQACSELTGTVCVPCPPDTYTAHPNGLGQCLPCQGCDPAVGLDTRQKCSRRQDTVCGCRQGYFCEAKDRDHCIMCLPHTVCHPGQRVQRRGTDSQDTVCATCPLGTFSPNGTLEQCLPWTTCTGWFETEAEQGTSSRDASCSPSGAFYVAIALAAVTVLVLVLIGGVWTWMQRRSGSEHSGKMALQQRQIEEGAGESAVTQAPPEVTTVAVEETALVFKALGPDR